MIDKVLNKLLLSFGALIAALISIFSVFSYGKRKGKEEERHDIIEGSLKTGLGIKKDGQKRISAGASAARKQLRKSAIDR